MDSENIQFYFMPFDELKLSARVPTLVYVFEEQEDKAISDHFPEIEKLRKMTDSMKAKDNTTFQLFPIRQNRKTCILGIVYIQYPWKKRKNWKVDDINFYRTVSERSVFAVEQLREKNFREMTILLPGRFHPKNIVSDIQREKLMLFVQTITESIIYGNNTLDAYKKDPKPKITSVTFTYFGHYGKAVDGFFQKAIGDGKSMGNTLSYVRRLIELPTNEKYPSLFIEHAVGVAPKQVMKADKGKALTWAGVKGHSFSPQTHVSLIYGTETLRRFGFGLIAAVGQGSAHEPVLLKVHYKPATEREKPVKKIVLTGKGVTFDSGGIDLKLTGSYENMHYDMAGAATVLGAVRLAEEHHLPVEVVALVPVVHNAIGPQAIDPHSVVRAFDGTTVEIINTDCEGRLILADAIAYSEKHLRPDCTISVATLCDISGFAPDILKVLAATPALEKKARVAEQDAAEKIILWPSLSHLNHIDNEYVGDRADLVNEISFGEQSAGIVFLADFLQYDPAEWMYIDVGAQFEKDASDYGAGPGFGLRFLWYVLKQFT
ncbi:MAG: hypothetical protein BMS9Abin13_617 [Patescibacteria group bacterium]|nr:MAG: hypothetical protein BMS9Abin13_617 [Patescibacteria group bacterium]